MGASSSKTPKAVPTGPAIKSNKRSNDVSTPSIKRQKTQEATIQAQYMKLINENPTHSKISTNARLRVLRDILSYMHGHSTYDKTLLRDYSLLQHLLYAQIFASEMDYIRAPKQKPGSMRTFADVLKAYGAATKKIIGGDGPSESSDALQELNHAVRWGLCLLVMGKWQRSHPELQDKPFHCAVALYIHGELENEDGDSEFEDLRADL
jgi:hypothetical protein